MKVLFYPIANRNLVIHPTRACEYLTDSLYHGLRTLLGNGVTTPYHLWHMHKMSEASRPAMYGLGYTLYSLLDDIEWQNSDLCQRIANREFDCVIVTAHTTRGGRNEHAENQRIVVEEMQKFFDSYPASRIAFCDTLDQSHLLHPALFKKCHYFKRELEDNAHDFFLPIQYSIPAEKVMKGQPGKCKAFADIHPWNTGWKYTTEAEYYRQYRESLFGLTCKKGGWNSLRHFEILANGCVPYFTDIEACPSRTMTRFPKELCIRAKHIRGLKEGSIDTDFDSGAYTGILNELLEYTRQHLTTATAAQRLLEVLS